MHITIEVPKRLTKNMHTIAKPKKQSLLKHCVDLWYTEPTCTTSDIKPLVATMKLSEHFHCVIKFLDGYKPTTCKNNLGHPLCCFLGQHTLSSFGLCLGLDTHDTPTPVSSVLIKFVVEVGLHNNIHKNLNQVSQRHDYLIYPITHLISGLCTNLGTIFCTPSTTD